MTVHDLGGMCAIASLTLGALLCGCPADDEEGGGEATTTDADGATDTATGTDPATGADTGESTGTTGGEPFDGRLLVTADWRNKTLSLLDHEALVSGAQTRDEILVGEIDLSQFEPGPLQVEVTPDGRTAVVSISPGFYDGIVGSSIGVDEVPLDGTLLIVDLEARQVVAELATAHVPMGIAIDPEGRRAYTANFGHSDAPGSTMSVVDLDNLTVLEDIEVGAGPEQVSLSADGSLGILNLASDGTVVVFQTADPAGTLSMPVPTAADPSDVDFIDGTDFAVVANSLGDSVYTVLNVSDPAMPTVVTDGEPPGGIPYGLTKIPGTTEFVMTVAHDEVRFVRADATAPETFTWLHTVEGVAAFPLGVVVAAEDGVAISAAPGENALIVLQLDGSSARTIPWLPEVGPTYAALQPAG